jgi:hypothetical protein
LSPGGFVATLSISPVDQILGVSRFCLADSTFENSLSFSILGYYVCMPTGC